MNQRLANAVLAALIFLVISVLLYLVIRIAVWIVDDARWWIVFAIIAIMGGVAQWITDHE